MALTYPKIFPTAFLQPVVTARVKAEGKFRRQIGPLSTEEPPDPDALNAAAKPYVIAIFKAFAHQACEAGRAGKLRPDQIDEVVEEFIRHLAVHARDAFEDPLFGVPDVHLGWSGETPWLGEAIQAIKASPGWDEYLAELAEVAEPAPRVMTKPPASAGMAASSHDTLPLARSSDFRWQVVTIRFLDEHTVRITVGDIVLAKRDYEELGFAYKRSKLPNRAWLMLQHLAQNGGTLELPSGQWARDRIVARKVIQELRKILRNCMKTDADPVQFVRGEGYKTAFTIDPGSAFDS